LCPGDRPSEVGAKELDRVGDLRGIDIAAHRDRRLIAPAHVRRVGRVELGLRANLAGANRVDPHAQARDIAVDRNRGVECRLEISRDVGRFGDVGRDGARLPL